MKHCSKCLTYKPLEEFTKNNGVKSGLNSWCKCCTRQNSRNGHLKNRLKRNAQVAEYRKTKKGKEVMKKANEKWVKENPFKHLAHQAVEAAVKRGLLNPELCHCGSDKVQAHHDDYQRPYSVKWVCVQHHADIHAQKRALNRLTSQ